MRIAAISHACVIDVNQRLFRQLSRHEGVELLLIAPRRWKASIGMVVDFREVEDAGFESAPLPVIGSGRISSHLYRGLGTTLRRFEPEIVYLDEEPYSLPAWQTLRICRRAGYRLCFMSAQNRVKHYPWPFRRIERGVFDYAELAVPPAPAIADVLRRKGFEGEIEVIPHFVDLELFRPLDRSDLRRELGLRGSVLGYMGRLTEEKGLMDLRHAAETLWDRGRDVSVMLVGGGPMADVFHRWRSFAPEGRVVLTGPVPHSAAPEYMNVFEILVLPSWTTHGWEEQFGRVLIEAPACGIPTVGSSSGNIPQIIEQLGSGLVFQERDPEALADAVEELLEDPQRAREMAHSGRERARKLFSLPAVASRLYEALSGMSR